MFLTVLNVTPEVTIAKLRKAHIVWHSRGRNRQSKDMGRGRGAKLGGLVEDLVELQ